MSKCRCKDLVRIWLQGRPRTVHPMLACISLRGPPKPEELVGDMGNAMQPLHWACAHQAKCTHVGNSSGCVVGVYPDTGNLTCVRISCSWRYLGKEGEKGLVITSQPLFSSLMLPHSTQAFILPHGLLALKAARACLQGWDGGRNLREDRCTMVRRCLNGGACKHANCCPGD